MPSFTTVVKATSLAAAVWQPVHYPPAASNLNNLTYAVQGSGVNGIYNSSQVPDSQYGIYNYCNMPHARTKEYKQPAKDYELQYSEVIHRHHKRTPYSSNVFPKEDITWTCGDARPLHFAGTNNVAQVQWSATTSSANPMTATVGPGFVGSDCQFPSITSEGLNDSRQHGSDLRDLYSRKLHFLPKNLDTNQVKYRVTNNVLGALVTGMYPLETGKVTSAAIQSSSFDSLEPTYSCPYASGLRSAAEGTNANWTANLNAMAPLYAKLDAVSGIPNPDNGGWHTSIDHYFDNLSSKLCHQKSLPCSVNDTNTCVTQAQAEQVFRLGTWMYDYRFRSSENSTRYASLMYTGFLRELQSHIKDKMAGKSDVKWMHNVAHDGSMSQLLGTLQVDTMVWPGMGAEVIFELYKSKKSGAWFMRVLWGGQPLKTSTPLGTLDMIKVENFMAYLDQQLPQDLVSVCSSS